MKQNGKTWHMPRAGGGGGGGVGGGGGPLFDNSIYFTIKINVPPQNAYRHHPVPDHVANGAEGGPVL